MIKINKSESSQSDLNIFSTSNWFAVIKKRYYQFGHMMFMPISCLACSGLLMVLSVFLSSLSVPYAQVLLQSGHIIYQYIPLLVAVFIVESLVTQNRGKAIIAAALSTLVFMEAASAVARLLSAESASDFNFGWLTGLLSGFMTYGLFRSAAQRPPTSRSAKWVQPDTLILWEIPLASVGGGILGFIWHGAERLLTQTAHWISQSHEAGLFVYGFLNRLLLPLGLHHILDDDLWFQEGAFTTQKGEWVQGDLSRFLAGDPTAGRTTAGFFPVMMIVIPAVLLAVWVSGRAKRHHLSKWLLLAAALLSCLGGITEPADYLILLISPLLYLFYAACAGLSLMVASQLKVLHGFTFSAGLMDYIWHWSDATRPGWLLPLGFSIGTICFVVFWFFLRRDKGNT